MVGKRNTEMQSSGVEAGTEAAFLRTAGFAVQHLDAGCDWHTF